MPRRQSRTTYEIAAAAAWKKKAEEQAEAARCEAAAKKGTGEASSEAPAGEKKVFSQAGVAYGQSRWGAESVLSDSETGEDESLEQVSDDDFYKIEADKSFKAWSRLDISWENYYTDLQPSPSGYDLLEDLMPLGMGVLYRQLILTDPQRRLYGYIPLMAACSTGQIGALNAVSFCERVLSVANLVVTDGNTLLSDDEVEMVAVLRVNRAFMEYMRATYSEESRQQFNQTLVEDDQGAILEEI